MPTCLKQFAQQNQFLIGDVSFNPEIGDYDAILRTGVQLASQVRRYRGPVRHGCAVHRRSAEGPEGHSVGRVAVRRMNGPAPNTSNAGVVVDVLAVPIGDTPDSEWDVNCGLLSTQRFLLPEFARPFRTFVDRARYLILEFSLSRYRVNRPDRPRRELKEGRHQRDDHDGVAKKKVGAQQKLQEGGRTPGPARLLIDSREIRRMFIARVHPFNAFE